MNKLQELHELGQCTWLNELSRSLILSGDLRKFVEVGIQGLTANATTFEAVIGQEITYDEAIWQQVVAGVPAPQIQNALMIHDVQIAADYLHDIYQESNGLDGFVTLELNPRLMFDTVNTVAEVRHLESLVNRSNVMVEVPATPAGIEAVDLLTRDGVSLNVTHVFSVALYEQVAQAYIRGLEYFLEKQSAWRFTPMSVVSFSLSPLDAQVDAILMAREAADLVGRTAVCQAKLLYGRCQQIFSGPRWEKAARRGANILRPKWSRTTPYTTQFPDTYYVDALIGPHTLTTFSRDTMAAFLDHGQPKVTLTNWTDQVANHMEQLEEMGIDVEGIAQALQDEYLQASAHRFHSITKKISQKREEMEQHRSVASVH